MIRLLCTWLLCLLFATGSVNAHQTIPKGSVNQWITIRIIDSTALTPETGVTDATAGLDLEYFRIGAAAVNLTEVDNADPNTHTDGGLYHVGHGLYLVGLPDAAFATGQEFVTVQGTATGMIVIGQTIQLSPTGQQRVNNPPGASYLLTISNMASGAYKATQPIRLRPGSLTNSPAIGVDMSAQFGDTFVTTVGAPTVSAGSITAAAIGPRDTLAMIQLGGTATADEKRTVTFDVTMATGDKIPVTFDVEVFSE